MDRIGNFICVDNTNGDEMSGKSMKLLKKEFKKLYPTGDKKMWGLFKKNYKKTTSS